MANTHSIDLERGSVQYLYIADGSQTGLDLTGNFTLEGLVKFESLPSSGETYWFVGKWNTTGNQRAYRFGLENSAGTYRLTLSVSSNGTLETTVTSNWTPTTATWYYVGIVWQTTGSTNAQFYVGQPGVTPVAQGSAIDATDTTPFNSTATFFIGTHDGATPTFDGKLDNWRVWNTDRTLSQIQNNAYKELSTDTNLKGNWLFNNAYTDASGNSNTLTSDGSPVFSTDVAFNDSPSLSVSPTPSASVSLSISPTPSSSVSPSPSVSVSLSPSVSVSLSPSLSPSLSASLSPSVSVSASPSPSIDAGSPSPSLSPSLSASLSPSASASPSSSISLSSSRTASSSFSRSPSPSHSFSNSKSASLSASISDSPSPSAPESLYTREATTGLPSAKNDLATVYTTQEEYDVFSSDGNYVALLGGNNTYLVHQFKKLNNNRTDRIKVRVDLKSTRAPSDTPIYLAIWNGQTNAFEVLDSDVKKEADTELSLTGDVSDTAYFDFNNEACVRVYQENATGSNQTLSVDMVRIDFLAVFRDKFASRDIQYRNKYRDKNDR